MRPQAYFLGSAGVFAMVAAGHLARILLNCPLIIGGWVVPPWMSAFAILGSGFLAVCGLRLATRRPRRP